MIDYTKIDPHVPADRASNLYGVQSGLRALIAEARAVTTHELLTAWKSEARALVDSLENTLARHQERIAAFEAAVPPLERALEAERQARDELAAAQYTYAQGSADRKEQLKRRDDVEAAGGALTVRIAERIAAVNAVGHLPQNAGVGEGGDRAMVQLIADKVEGLKFHKDRTQPLDVATWRRWLEIGDAEMMWIPLYAARIVAKAKPEFEDARTETVTLPRKDFVAKLEQFKREREARIRSRLAEAKALVAQATADAAALEGAAQ